MWRQRQGVGCIDLGRKGLDLGRSIRGRRQEPEKYALMCGVPTLRSGRQTCQDSGVRRRHGGQHQGVQHRGGGLGRVCHGEKNVFHN